MPLFCDRDGMSHKGGVQRILTSLGVEGLSDTGLVEKYLVEFTLFLGILSPFRSLGCYYEQVTRDGQILVNSFDTLNSLIC